MERTGKRKDQREPFASTSDLSTKKRKGDEAEDMSEPEMEEWLECLLSEGDYLDSDLKYSESDNSEKSDSDEEDTDASPRFSSSKPVSSPVTSSSGTVSDISTWVTDQPVDQPQAKPFVFAGTEGLKKLPEGNTPREFFNLLATDSFYNHIVRATNIRAEKLSLLNPDSHARITQWKELTVEEFRIFLGLLFHMGTIRMNRLNDYWKKGKLFDLKCFSSFMSRDRFRVVLQALHFAEDPEEGESFTKNKLYKIRPLIDLFHSQMRSIYSSKKELCVDEPMVLWRGCLIFRQYMKNKRRKYKLKVYMLTEPSGLVLKFIVHPGQEDSDKKLRRGEEIHRFNGKGVCVLKWKDRHDVLMVSSEFGNRLVEVPDRKGVIRNKPEAVARYNTRMGAIHTCDQLLSSYPCERKSTKWYKKLGIHIFQLMLINSYILFNRYSTKMLNLYNFRLEVISSLLPDSLISIQSCPRISVSHFPEFTNQMIGNRRKQKRCRVCYSKSISKKVTTYCPDCSDEPGLCLRPCFIEYHKDL